MMASAGLKRSSSSDVDPHSDISSPFWPSNKRRCTTNYSPLNNLQQQQHQMNNQQQQRPFRDPSQILGSLSDEVTSMIKNEISKQHHNHHHSHHQSHQTPQSLTHQQPNQSTSFSGLHQQPQQQPQQHHQQQQHHTHHQSHQPSSSSSTSPSAMDTIPILSYRQTQHICEEVIRKREQKLREEYDKILITKLAEQYETFVKYTQDHIERRYNEESSHQASYLS
jgi:hypothetical protein